MLELNEDDDEPRNVFQFLELKQSDKAVVLDNFKNISISNLPGIHLFEIKNNSNFEICVHTHESLYDLILKHQDFRRYLSPELIKVDLNTWKLKFSAEYELDIELEIRYLSTIQNKQLKALCETDVGSILATVKQEFDSKRAEELAAIVNKKIEMQKQHIEALLNKSQNFWRPSLESNEEHLDGPI